MSPQGSRDSRVSRVSRISVVPFFGELTNGKFEGKRQNKYTVNPVKPVKPVKSPPPCDGGRGDAVPWQPEAPPPLPPDVRHICPRCGGEAELLQNRAQCLRCLLVFSPPRLPSWVTEALWEGFGHGGAEGKPQGGPLTEQGARRWAR
jgi:hypothetical protein